MSGPDFGQVDIDLLADYIGGALEGTPEESAVAARLEDDPAWRAAYESLSGGMTLVGAELSRLAPEPMPTDLANRLDELFRTPTADNAGPSELGDLASAPPTAKAGGDSNASDAPATNFLRSRNAPATDDLRSGDAPATDDLRSGDTQTTSGLRSGSAPGTDDLRLHSAEGAEPADDPHAKDAGPGREGDPSGDSAIADPEPIAGDLAAPRTPHLAAVRGPATPGRTASGVRPKERNRPPGRRRMKWATPIAIAAGLIAFVGFGADYLAGRDATDTAETTAGAADKAAPMMSRQILRSGTNYTLGTLGVEPVSAFDAGGSAASAAAGKTTDRAQARQEAALARLTPEPALQACLDAIERENAGGPIEVQSVDYALFEGKPAVVVRFSAANGLQAWASGPSCGSPAGDADTLGNVPVR